MYFSGKQRKLPILPNVRRPNNFMPTMALASNLRMAMWQRAKEAMAKKR